MNASYPTLSTTTNDIKTTHSEICSKILLFAIANPGDTSDYFEDYQVSLRKLKAECEANPSELCVKFAGELASAIGDYFPDSNIQVSVEHTDPDSSGCYGLQITIAYENGISVIPMHTVQVEGNQIRLIDNV